MSDADIKKVVDRWVAVAKESDQEVVTVEVAVCDPPYPAYMVRDIYEAACAKDAGLIQRLVDALAWYVSEDDVMVGGEWDELNAPWIEALRGAEAVLADAAAAGFKPTDRRAQPPSRTSSTSA